MQLCEEGLDREGDAGSADASFIVAVFSAIRSEHVCEGCGHTHGDGSKCSHDQEPCRVVIGYEELGKSQHSCGGVCPVEQLKLVHLPTDHRDESTQYNGRENAQDTGDRTDGFIPKADPRDVQAPDTGHIQRTDHHESNIENEQILIVLQVAEHLFQSDILLGFLFGIDTALLRGEADGHHGDRTEYGKHDDGLGPAAQHGAEGGNYDHNDHGSSHGAHTADGVQGGALMLDIGNGGYQAKDRYIANGIGGIPQNVSNNSPGDLRAHGKTVGNRKEHNRSQGNSNQGNSEPGNEFSLFEVNPVNDSTEDGIVDRVPDLDHQRDSGNSHRRDAGIRKVGVHEHIDQKIEDVLTCEV